MVHGDSLGLVLSNAMISLKEKSSGMLDMFDLYWWLLLHSCQQNVRELLGHFITVRKKGVLLPLSPGFIHQSLGTQADRN
ncbi:hypothetical protein SUGI_1131580 [Cryptomeria japonica]|nr:hypothetical protein SUGI_1131580 [Cryptomeria japonica]